MVLRNIRAGIGELWRTFNLNAQVKDLQRFVPELKREDVIRGPAGVRAQVTPLYPDPILILYIIIGNGL